MMMMMMLSGDIDWFEIEDEDLEYPFLPCVDSIWTPPENKN